jgi:hypothetical protein
LRLVKVEALIELSGTIRNVDQEMILIQVLRVVIGELLALDHFEKQELTVIHGDRLIDKSFRYLALISEVKPDLCDHPGHFRDTRWKIKRQLIILGDIFLTERYLFNGYGLSVNESLILELLCPFLSLWVESTLREDLIEL